MWLMTKIGFYSIVQKPWDMKTKTLTVRARCAADLERFRAICPGLGPTKRDDVADYRYRAQGPRESVSDAVWKLANAVNYDNFKSEISKDDPTRANLYTRCWAALLPIQAPSSTQRERLPFDEPRLPSRQRRRLKARWSTARKKARKAQGKAGG